MKKKMVLIIVLLLTSPIIVKADTLPYLLNTKLVTNDSNSYLGFQNDKFTGDNATRLYILPRDHVTTGAGGVLKIFGDAYQLGQDYRDLGMYFYADQNGDKGTNGNGVFWLNQKVFPGGQYDGKNPDIGFSFQDGQYVAGRFSLVNKNTVFVVGKGNPQVSILNSNIREEIQGNLGLRNNDYIQWASVDGTRTFGISGDLNNMFKISSLNGITSYVNGSLMMQIDKSKTDVKNSLVTSSLSNPQSISTIDASNTNRIKLTADGIVSKIIGNDGQTITILFKNDGATVQNNDSIKLAKASDFTGGLNSTLVLENIEGTWYELSRSINHN